MSANDSRRVIYSGLSAAAAVRARTLIEHLCRSPSRGNSAPIIYWVKVKFPVFSRRRAQDSLGFSVSVSSLRLVPSGDSGLLTPSGAVLSGTRQTVHPVQVYSVTFNDSVVTLSLRSFPNYVLQLRDDNITVTTLSMLIVTE